MYRDAVPPGLHGIARARHLVARACEAGREDALDAQLAGGMFDAAAQFRTVGIFALRATYPLTGRDWPRDIVAAGFPGGAEGLDARLGLAAEQVRALGPEDFEGAGSRTIRHQAGDAELTQRAGDYLTLFALPNLWFHLSMGYAILRQAGLAIGKADFDGFHAYAPNVRFVE